ncbi:MAG: amidoligase family protein [Micropepsaceae bacterium]
MTSPVLGWKAGFEIELMMPAGRSRADLAARVAARAGGRVERFFHPQSEPSKVPGRPSFENLTPGFRVRDAAGAPVASFVDDLTLQRGLVKSAAPKPGWYRIVSDDGRLLRLAMRHGDAEADLETALKPLADLFGTDLEPHEGGMLRVVDERRISVAIGAPLPGERERPCEIVTAPIERDHADVLEALIADARAEGCTVPAESATHVHFDAKALESAGAMAALTGLLWRHGDVLKMMIGFNPNCVRLGKWPEALPALTATPAFRAMAWPEARAAMLATGITKYCDYNVLNIASDNRAKPTFELRVLPTALEVRPVLMAAALFEAILRWCAAPGAAEQPVPASPAALVDALALAPDVRAYWSPRAFTMSHGTGY